MEIIGYGGVLRGLSTEEGPQLRSRTKYNTISEQIARTYASGQ